MNNPTVEQIREVQEAYIAELMRYVSCISHKRILIARYSKDLEQIQGRICTHAAQGAKHHRLKLCCEIARIVFQEYLHWVFTRCTFLITDFPLQSL